jgi:hypothetical protein
LFSVVTDFDLGLMMADQYWISQPWPNAIGPVPLVVNANCWSYPIVSRCHYWPTHRWSNAIVGRYDYLAMLLLLQYCCSILLLNIVARYCCSILLLNELSVNVCDQFAW